MRIPVSGRKTRWAVPAGAVAAVAAVAVASAITVAQAAPGLPSRTPAELLAAVAGARSAPPPLTGTVVESASLGIPQLPGTQNPTSITSLLAGSHTVRVWYADAHQFRLSAPVTMGESDLIRNGNTAWLWQTGSDTAARIVIPAGAEHKPGAGDWQPQGAPLTPQQAARQVLAAVGPSTKVSSESNAEVAGQAAYQLVLTPRDSRSLVGRVTIALDGQHPNVPLRVQVFARGATTPAFGVGYTSVSFVRPAPANFAFTPPRGARVSTLHPGGSMPRQGSAQMSAPQVVGKDWLTVGVFPARALAGLESGGNAAGAAGQAARSVSGSGNGVDSSAILGALLKSATPVHGTWGSGNLLKTSLVSVLITSDGHVLVGAVSPEVLYAAAAHVK
jgi:hypothetical protein